MYIIRQNCSRRRRSTLGNTPSRDFSPRLRVEGTKDYRAHAGAYPASEASAEGFAHKNRLRQSLKYFLARGEATVLRAVEGSDCPKRISAGAGSCPVTEGRVEGLPLQHERIYIIKCETC